MLELVFIFLLGLIWGSFLSASESRLSRLLFWMNSIALNRHPNTLIKYFRLSFLKFFISKSRCDHCKHSLSWHQNIPLISFVLLQGRCGWCQKLIDKKLFLIEFLSGLVFILLFITFGDKTLSFIFAVLLFSLLYLISSFDIKHLLIPDLYSYAVLWLGIIFFLSHQGDHYLFEGILATIISYTLLKLLSLIYLLGFGRVVLGDADPLLAGALSIWLGWEYLPAFFLAASIIGFIWVLLTSAISKKDIWQQRIPFGPALCCSAASIFIFKNIF
jgi:prepilin signal peptidase PulO-like enzyme (type II secretory pathway)